MKINILGQVLLTYIFIIDTKVEGCVLHMSKREKEKEELNAVEMNLNDTKTMMETSANNEKVGTCKMKPLKKKKVKKTLGLENEQRRLAYLRLRWNTMDKLP